MPIMIHGGGGATEVQYAKFTKDMFSLDGEHLVITFPSTVPVKNLVAFGAVLALTNARDKRTMCSFYYCGVNKIMCGYGDNFSAGREVIVNETSNTIKTNYNDWTDYWNGAQSNLIIRNDTDEWSFYCYT